MHQIRNILGLCTRLRCGRLQFSPDLLAGLMGPTAKDRGNGMERRKEKRKEGKKKRQRKGRESMGHHILPEFPPMHWIDHCFTFKMRNLILRKIIQFVATGCQILRLKCTKFNFGWVSAPDTLARYRGPTSKGREGWMTPRFWAV